jgi:hypothetical protein
MKIVLLLMMIPTLAIGQSRIDVSNNSDGMNGVFFQVVAGTPVGGHTFYRVVEGTPFFSEGWSRGSAFLTKDKEYKNLWLRLDLIADQVHFRDAKGNDMVCSTPLARLILVDSATGVPHVFIHASSIPALVQLSPLTWVEVHAEGKAQLYTQYKKAINESRPYGSATLEQRIHTSSQHYMVVGDKMARVKKVQDIIDALPDKQQEMQQWVNSNKVEKNVNGFAKVIAHYNSLVN